MGLFLKHPWAAQYASGWLVGLVPGSFGVRRLNGLSGALNLKLMGVV